MTRTYSEVIKEEIHEVKLTNGLTVALFPRPGFNRQYAMLSVNCGSIDMCFRNPFSGERLEVPSGMAHFLEHKLFEDKEDSIFDKFAALGSRTNAHTGFTRTSYIFSSTDRFGKSLQNLLDFVQEPHFTAESIEKEKLIIAREIEMYEDNPEWQCFFNLLRAMYHEFPLIYDIAGTKESIIKINKDLLDLYYATFYHPLNMVLFVAGDFDINRVVNIIRENQQGKEFAPLNKIERYYPDEPQNCHRKEIKKIMDLPSPIINIGFKGYSNYQTGEELVRDELLISMLIELMLGKSSQMYEELYEQGLIDNTFAGNQTADYNFSFVNLGGRTEDPGQLAEIMPRVLKTAVESLDINDFKRIKRKYRGEYISGFNSFEMVGSEFVNLFFKGLNIFDKIKIMESIVFDELFEKYSTLFTEEKMSVSIIEDHQ